MKYWQISADRFVQAVASQKSSNYKKNTMKFEIWGFNFHGVLSNCICEICLSLLFNQQRLIRVFIGNENIRKIVFIVDENCCEFIRY